MRKRILAFIMSSVFALSMMCVPSAEAKRIQREYGDMIVTVIDEETDELFDLDCCFSILPCDESWNTLESNPFTVKNVLKEASYVVVSDCAAREYDGYKYSIDYKTTNSQFFYDKSEETYNITIYMKKEPIKQNDNCGTVNITVIDEDTNELFTEHSLFSISDLRVNWDAALCNPLTLKNVPLNTAGSIVNDTYYMRDDDYYYAIDYAKDSSAFLWQVKEKVNDITVYVHKLPREDKVEYGDIKVTVIDEETNELFSDPKGKDVVFNAYSSSMIMPSDPFFGGCVSLDEWNVNENNPFVIEDVILNNYISIVYHWAFSYVENRNYCYVIDEEKSQTPFCFTSPEQNEITVYMKKVYSVDSVKDDQLSETDTSVINADKDYTFEDIRSMTTAEIEALYEAKGMTWEKGYHIYKPETVLSNGFYQVQLDPKPFMTAGNGEELVTEVYSADDMHELIEDGDVIWDIGKIYSALELSPELFDIQPSVSMTCLTGNEETGPIYRKYCNCVIKPYADDRETAVTLYTAMLNYVQLRSCCEGIHFEGMGATSYAAFRGDVNGDAIFDICDIVALQRWLLGADGAKLVNWRSADLCADNKLDVFDLTAMKKALLENSAQ
ncbi:MAG: dockerin type I repeat-containing protein [Ruminococcus sp.]|uniref:dockerin type I repeat-containing protein n=1 Tax=Ruminococcus sp. TaxID=41978 RepID=UPI0025F22F5D|nr:dockerin type I repeat-containing protein [Ruminococcus sp.]MBR5683104.1 dockerin type I repeat-containing protein [Ruminococcus sp.]